ncbi:hypothetical protein Q5M85_10440 [Paraclostridium bifermentans]|nr:hypothetical protein [Paraclostridium bifermentans]
MAIWKIPVLILLYVGGIAELNSLLKDPKVLETQYVGVPNGSVHRATI